MTTPTSSAWGLRSWGEKLAYDLLRAFVDARFTEEEYFRRRDAKLAALERRLLEG